MIVRRDHDPETPLEVSVQLGSYVVGHDLFPHRGAADEIASEAGPLRPFPTS